MPWQPWLQPAALGATAMPSCFDEKKLAKALKKQMAKKHDKKKKRSKKSRGRTSSSSSSDSSSSSSESSSSKKKKKGSKRRRRHEGRHRSRASKRRRHHEGRSRSRTSKHRRRRADSRSHPRAALVLSPGPGPDPCEGQPASWKLWESQDSRQTWDASHSGKQWSHREDGRGSWSWQPSSSWQPSGNGKIQKGRGKGKRYPLQRNSDSDLIEGSKLKTSKAAEWWQHAIQEAMQDHSRDASVNEAVKDGSQKLLFAAQHARFTKARLLRILHGRSPQYDSDPGWSAWCC